jgi:hypothetical protein
MGTELGSVHKWLKVVAPMRTKLAAILWIVNQSSNRKQLILSAGGSEQDCAILVTVGPITAYRLPIQTNQDSLILKISKSHATLELETHSQWWPPIQLLMRIHFGLNII